MALPPIEMDSSVSHERRNLFYARVPSHFSWPLPTRYVRTTHLRMCGVFPLMFGARMELVSDRLSSPQPLIHAHVCSRQGSSARGRPRKLCNVIPVPKTFTLFGLVHWFILLPWGQFETGCVVLLSGTCVWSPFQELKCYRIPHYPLVHVMCEQYTFTHC